MENTTPLELKIDNAGSPDLVPIASDEAVAPKMVPNPMPTRGRIVHYRLSLEDAGEIMKRREEGSYTGNPVKEGDTYPMMIVAVWGSFPESAVNGQVFLDGQGTFWVTSVTVGEGPRQFTWPQR